MLRASDLALWAANAVVHVRYDFYGRIRQQQILINNIPVDQYTFIAQKSGYHNPKFVATQTRRKHLQKHFAKPSPKRPKGK